MKLDTHIAYRLLHDPTLWVEIVQAHSESDGINIMEGDNVDNYINLYRMLESKGNKSYYVTDSVLNKLHLFDSKKALKIDKWIIFKDLPNFKKTFILSDGRCIRVQKNDTHLQIMHISFKMHPKAQRTKYDAGEMYWVLVYVDFLNGELCEHFMSEDGKMIAPFIFSLLCFTELTENETIEVKPNQKYGTQKTGKIINTYDRSIIVINNTWNITIIRGGLFPVSGHVALRRYGPGHSMLRLVYINPYQKEGYTRRSSKELNE